MTLSGWDAVWRGLWCVVIFSRPPEDDPKRDHQARSRKELSLPSPVVDAPRPSASRPSASCPSRHRDDPKEADANHERLRLMLQPWQSVHSAAHMVTAYTDHLQD